MMHMVKKKKFWALSDDDDEGFPFNMGDGEFLDGFNKIFKELMKQFQNNKDFQNFSKNIFKQLGMRSPGDLGLDPKKMDEIKKKGPFVYGFSVKFDEQGKPIFDKFGNIKPPKQPMMDMEKTPASISVREPIADVIEEDDEFVVVVELPGVKKEEIVLDANEDSIEIRAESGQNRKYQKNILLPGKVNPDKIKARLINGILEVRMKKI